MSASGLRARLPWWLRIAAKLVLSRVPAGYPIWRRLNLFVHGAMHHADYALGVFERHYRSSFVAGAPAGFTALELGPGDSLSSAMIAAAHGAGRVHLVDSGRYATEDMAAYRELERALAARGLRTQPIVAGDDLGALLSKCRAEYGTEGLRSLRAIQTASVDLVWSHAVLEHVRRGEFLATMRELRRVLRPDGVCSHVVDLQDHLGGALDNMRIASSVWEADWMASSGFYTNRLRMAEMVAMFEQAGFTVRVNGISRWERIPTPRRALAAEFQHHPDSELLIKGFDVTLSPTAVPAGAAVRDNGAPA